MKSLMLTLFVLVSCSKMGSDAGYTLSPSFNVDFEVVSSGVKNLEGETKDIAVRVAGNLTQLDYNNVVKSTLNKISPVEKATIRLVDSRTTGNIGEIGVAAYVDKKFSIMFTSQYIAQWGEGISKLYDEVKRKSIYSEVSALRQKAALEAQGKDFLFEEELLKKYYDELKTKYKLQEGHLVELDNEALDKAWN